MFHDYHSAHTAMAAEFTLTVRNADDARARDAARALWEEIDRLESLLSRFRDGSDIYAVNHSPAGATVALSEETELCLRLAMRVTMATQGVFDVGVGGLSEAVESSADDGAVRAALRRKKGGSLILHEDSARITILDTGMKLDLGAIGKGFAVDWAQTVLQRYGIDDFLLGSGGHSVWANAPEGRHWRVRLAGDTHGRFVRVRQCAVSASGTSIQGAHILDPERGVPQNCRHKRSWAICQCGALADALATASLLMPPEAVRASLAALGETCAVVLEPYDGGANWEVIDFPQGAFAPDSPAPDADWSLRLQ